MFFYQPFLYSPCLSFVRITALSIRVQPKTRPQGKKNKQTPKQLNNTKLKDVPTKQSFVEALDERLGAIFFYEQDVEAAWITLRDTIYCTDIECLGPSTRRHRDWFDESHVEIMDLIGKKRADHLAHLHAHLQHCSAQAVRNARFLDVH